jgi:hypothetical protein
LLCAVTTVFKLIAPVRTSMARNKIASLRDIVPPGIKGTQVHSIPYGDNVK